MFVYLSVLCVRLRDLCVEIGLNSLQMGFNAEVGESDAESLSELSTKKKHDFAIISYDMTRARFVSGDALCSKSEPFYSLRR